MAGSQTAENFRHTGARIRDRRLALGQKQAELAARAGISASYLNLIEHNKRRIGGKLLVDLAQALGCEPGALTGGPEASLYRALTAAAALQQESGLRPEIDRIDALVARFPGWAGAIAAQNRRIAALEALNDALGDRMGHDLVLAEGMHELLSTVAAIRSTAAILAEETALEPQWQARFHRNLHEEAERLAGRATSLSRRFDGDDPGTRTGHAPAEAVERLYERANHAFPMIEAGGRAAIADVLAAEEGFEEPAARALATTALERYADDALALPLEEFTEAAAAVDFMPERLYALAQGDMARLLRRLASLPPQSGAPEFGLAICDAAGALLMRRRLSAFSVPRFRPGCPQLPLYRAFARPLSPERVRLDLAGGTVLDTWSVAQPAGADRMGHPILEATMLVRVITTGVRAARTSCEVCGGSVCLDRRGMARAE